MYKNRKRKKGSKGKIQRFETKTTTTTKKQVILNNALKNIYLDGQKQNYTGCSENIA